MASEALLKLRVNSFGQRQARLLQRRGITTYLNVGFPPKARKRTEVVTRVILVFSDNH